MIELMIGLATGLFLLAGVIGIFAMSLKSNSDNLKMTRLNQELRSAMDLMQRELRRTAYWHLATYAASPAGNLIPSSTSGSVNLNSVYDDSTTAVDSFSQFFDMLSGAITSDGAIGLKVITEGASATITSSNSANQVSATVTNDFSSTALIKEGAWMIENPFSNSTYDLAISVSGDCITYAYDQDDPITNPTAIITAAQKTAVGNNERFGFRLANNAVEMYRYTSAARDCTAAAETDDWNPVTSPSISITALSFSNASGQCVNLTDNSSNCNVTTPDVGDLLLYIREIDISMTGQLINDASVSRTLTETVRLRNDRITIY